MKSMRVLSSILFAAGSLLFATSAFAGGPEIFTASKCTKCHSVSNAGIESAKKPILRDLSAVGAAHDAAWLTKFLKKEVGLPGKDGDKMHKVEWKGSEGDLTALAGWLAEQKTPVKAPAEPAEE